MKQDVLQAYLQKTMPPKRPSKETLNHAGLIFLASGIDPYQNTQAAYMGAYKSLGIDVLNRVPSSHNVRRIVGPGESAPAPNGYTRAYLGLYDTFFRHTYPIASVDDFFETEHFDFDYSSFITPVPHRIDADLIRQKELIAGDIGFLDAIGAHHTPFVVVTGIAAVRILAAQPNFCQIVKAPVLIDLSGVQVAVIVSQRHLFGVIVIQMFGGLVLQDKIPVHKLFHIHTPICIVL